MPQCRRPSATRATGKTSGLISRRSRITQLEEMIDNINGEIAQLEGDVQRNTQNKIHMEKLCKDLRTAIYEASTEKTQVNSKLALFEQDIKRLKEEEPLIASELGSLEEEIAQSVQKEYDSKQRLEELESVNNQRAAHIRELEAMVDELREQQQSRLAELTELKVQLGQVAEQQKGVAADYQQFGKPDPDEPANADHSRRGRALVWRAGRRGTAGYSGMRVRRLRVVRREGTTAARQPLPPGRTRRTDGRSEAEGRVGADETRREGRG